MLAWPGSVSRAVSRRSGAVLALREASRSGVRSPVQTWTTITPLVAREAESRSRKLVILAGGR